VAGAGRLTDQERLSAPRPDRGAAKMPPLLMRTLVSIVLLLADAGFALAHWPGQPNHRMAYLGDFALERGGIINDLKISYVTHGTLSAAKDNAILFMHTFGSNHHQFDHLIGPGRPLDTDKYFVICPDLLGSTQTTFEHSTSPTNSGLKMQFPLYNGRDVVRANHQLVTHVLGIPHLLAATGFARGGIFALQLAVSYPDFVDAIVPISASARVGTTTFFRLQMLLSLIESCEGWQDGNYDVNPKRCIANAMSLLIPYMYTPEYWVQYVDTPEAYTKWRNTMGDYYLDIQDARDVYYLIKSGGHGSLADTPGFGGDIFAALRSIRAKTLFIGNRRDEIIPPDRVEADAGTIPNARVVWIDSVAGHNICCNADPQATRLVGEAIRDFVGELAAREEANR
jgi:homoserine O-acetyltransferase